MIFDHKNQKCSQSHNILGFKIILAICVLNLFWTFCYYLGGQDVVGTQKTAEMIYLNGSRTEGPMPDNGRYGHCMVEYAGIIILMGGG